VSESLSAWEALSLNDQMGKPPNRKWAPYTPEEAKAFGTAVREFADKHGIKLDELEQEQ
jgi:hypothetical protein